eukprot:gene21528-28516_t
MGGSDGVGESSHEEKPWYQHWTSRAAQLRPKGGDGQKEPYSTISTTRYLLGGQQYLSGVRSHASSKLSRAPGYPRRIDGRYARDYVATHKAHRQDLVDFTASASGSTLSKAASTLSPRSILGYPESSDGEVSEQGGGELSIHHPACTCSGCTARSLRRTLSLGHARQSLWEASRRYSGEYYDEREGGRRAWHEASSDSDSGHVPRYTRRELAVETGLHQRVASHLERAGLFLDTLVPNKTRYTTSAPSNPRSLTSLKNTVVRNLVAEMESSEDEVPGSQPKYSLMHSSGLAPGGHASVMHQVSPYISHIAQVAAEEASARKQQRILDSVAAQKRERVAARGQKLLPPRAALPLEDSSEEETVDEMVQNDSWAVRSARRRRQGGARKLRLAAEEEGCRDCDSESDSGSEPTRISKQFNTTPYKHALSSGALGPLAKGKPRQVPMKPGNKSGGQAAIKSAIKSAVKSGRMDPNSRVARRDSKYLTAMWDSD